MTDHRLRLLTLWGTIALALTACSSDNTYLPALLADPMASYEAEGIVLIDALEQAESPGFLGGKPTHAEVVRSYRILNQSKAEQVLGEAVSFAESVDWLMQQDITTSTLFVGSKPLASRNGRLGIALGAEDPSRPDGARVLTVLLDFGTVGFDDTKGTTPGDD